MTLESEGDTSNCPVNALSERIVKLDDPVLVVSDCKTAVIVTVGVPGTAAGALYRPLASIVPDVEFPFGT